MSEDTMKHLTQNSQDVKAFVKAIGRLHSQFVSKGNAVVNSCINSVDRKKDAAAPITNCRFRFPISQLKGDEK